jgi:hypothetical protein
MTQIFVFTAGNPEARQHLVDSCPPILGVGLAVFGLLRVDRELRQLNHVRNLYRPLQDSLFYDFHKGKTSWFGAFVRTYIIVLILLAALNILFIWGCWMPEVPWTFCKLVALKMESSSLASTAPLHFLLANSQSVWNISGTVFHHSSGPASGTGSCISLHTRPTAARSSRSPQPTYSA